MRHDLAVVPPISKHNRRSSPRRFANQLPAKAPAAGPDSTSLIGAAAASAAETTPPLESIINTDPPKPSLTNHFCNSVRYGPIMGIVAALHAVVIMRGNSRICGEISAEMHTGTPSASLTASATIRSFDELA